tara:strand:- start:3609 stop:4808 length:1200 start_codon:yes stop_codon:yes gene_type:complete
MKLASIKLDSINKAVDGLTSAVREANLIASNIGKKVREANVRLRERISNANKDFQKRLDSQRKKQREELIEALGIGGAMRRTGQVIKNTAKGFLGRIMEFISVVLIGWAIMNIPKIIKGAQSLIGRLKKFYEVGEKIVGDLTQFLTNFGTELSQIFSNLLGFDFKPLQDKISSIMTKLQNDFRSVERGLIRDVSNLIDLTEDDILRMMGSPTEIEAIDQKISEQGIDMDQFNALPDSIKTGIRALAVKNSKEDKPIFDELDLEDLQNADSVEDFEQVLIDNRFRLKEINGKKVYVPPDAVETQNIEDDIKDIFNFDDEIKKNTKELDNKKDKEISFNSIKNERNFEMKKKSKDIFIPINDVNNVNFAKSENKKDSLQLNSDSDNGINSLDNQILTKITA